MMGKGGEHVFCNSLLGMALPRSIPPKRRAEAVRGLDHFRIEEREGACWGGLWWRSFPLKGD